MACAQTCDMQKCGAIFRYRIILYCSSLRKNYIYSSIEIPLDDMLQNHYLKQWCSQTTHMCVVWHRGVEQCYLRWHCDINAYFASRLMKLCLRLWIWWRHQMETFPRYCPNKRLSKQSWGWRWDTPSPSLWRHCNEYQWKRLNRAR